MGYAKHRKMRDVCLQVIEKELHGSFWMIKGLWINIAMGDPFPMGSAKRLAINTFYIPLEIWHSEWKEQLDVFEFEGGVSYGDA